MQNERAKAFLKNIFKTPGLLSHQRVAVIVGIARMEGITRAELKTARKEMGLQSENIGGEQYWSLPEDRA